MKNKSEVLCEIIYIDHKYNRLTSRIGTVNKHQLNDYSKNSNDFIIFNEKYNAPILKSDIKEIIIHQDNRPTSFKIEDLRINKYTKVQRTGKVS
ncbi:MAG: hypothetical protein ACFFCV_00360 [Promethearchaeota archaeon]